MSGIELKTLPATDKKEEEWVVHTPEDDEKWKDEWEWVEPSNTTAREQSLFDKKVKNQTHNPYSA